MEKPKEPSRLVTALCATAIAAVAVFFFAAYKPLIEIKTERVLCPEEDGGVSAAIGATTDGLNSMSCANPSATPVYVCGNTVDINTCYPICNDSDSCAGIALSMDTHKGQLTCITGSGAATADGGTPIKCIFGK